MLSYFLEGDPNTPGTFPDEVHELIAQYADAIRPYAKHHWTKSVNHELFGKKDCHSFKVENDLLLLFFFLLLIYYEKQDRNHFEDCPLNITDELRTKYKFECIEKYFKCYNIDVKALENIFGLGTIPADGINFMEIEGDGDCHPPFIIR